MKIIYLGNSPQCMCSTMVVPPYVRREKDGRTSRESGKRNCQNVPIYKVNGKWMCSNHAGRAAVRFLIEQTRNA